MRVIDMMTGAPLKFTVSGERPSTCSWRARCRRTAARRACGSPRPTRTRRAIAATATASCSIARFRFAAAAIVLPGRLSADRVQRAVAGAVADPDGRIRVSFMYQAPGAARADPQGQARRADRRRGEAAPADQRAQLGVAADAGSDRARAALGARASGSRHRLLPAAARRRNAFSLYHDYTESREGTDKYLNVVRTGSTVSNTSAKILDTGEALKAETLTGAQMKAAGIDAGGEQVAPDQQVVVTRFAPVKKGQSIRLRLSETYTAPQSYRARRRRVRVRAQPRPAAQFGRAAARLVSDRAVDSRRRPPDARRPDARRLRQRPAGFGGRADERQEAALIAAGKPSRPVLAGKTCRETPVEPRTDDLPEPGYCTTSVPTIPGWIVQ